MDWLQARGDPRGEFIALALVGDLNTNGHARAEAGQAPKWSRHFGRGFAESS
jgi:hypothetical protein